MLVVCGTAALFSRDCTEIAEHATVADLLEVVSSNRKYFGRVVTVVMESAECVPSHVASLHQPF